MFQSASDLNRLYNSIVKYSVNQPVPVKDELFFPIVYDFGIHLGWRWDSNPKYICWYLPEYFVGCMCRKKTCFSTNSKHKEALTAQVFVLIDYCIQKKKKKKKE